MEKLYAMLEVMLLNSSKSVHTTPKPESKRGASGVMDKYIAASEPKSTLKSIVQFRGVNSNWIVKCHQLQNSDGVLPGR